MQLPIDWKYDDVMECWIGWTSIGAPLIVIKDDATGLFQAIDDGVPLPGRFTSLEAAQTGCIDHHAGNPGVPG